MCSTGERTPRRDAAFLLELSREERVRPVFGRPRCSTPPLLELRAESSRAATASPHTTREARDFLADNRARNVRGAAVHRCRNTMSIPTTMRDDAIRGIARQGMALRDVASTDFFSGLRMAFLLNLFAFPERKRRRRSDLI